MKQMFGQSSKLRHDCIHLIEYTDAATSSLLSIETEWNVWLLQNDIDIPDISIPFALTYTVQERRSRRFWGSEDEEGLEILDYSTVGTVDVQEAVVSEDENL